MQRLNVPKGQKVLTSKLVFRTKRNQAGEITRYKVRWVVKGYQQKKGRDFDQTFARVYKSVTWKLAITMAALFNLKVEQMDAVTAFLNLKADTNIYV